ncbi:MAG: hypothetical protein ACREP2_13280 [Rhodanobacteraceae bacterium]
MNHRTTHTRPWRSAKRLFQLHLCAALLLLVTPLLPAQDAMSQPTPPQPASAPAQTPAEKYRADLQTKLDHRALLPADIQALTTYLTTATLPDALPYILILATYQRRDAGDPLAALETLAPAVLPKDAAAAWLQANAAAEKKSLAQWRKDLSEARIHNLKPLPDQPTGPFEPFPAFADWKLSPENTRCALAVARSLADLNQPQAAVTAINAIGNQTEDPRIKSLAGETGGDIMLNSQAYSQAVEFYQIGLQSAAAIHTYLGAKETAADQAIDARLKAKLATAQRPLDIEKYGLGWVLYREAETARLHDEDYAHALFLYNNLAQKFPKSVFSAAATCYSIKCLLALSDPSFAKQLPETIKTLETQLDHDQRDYKLLAYSRVPQKELAELAAANKELQERIASLKAAPTGAAALQAAQAQAQQFIAASPYGLYRGEVKVDLAQYAFQQQLDQQASARLYNDAWQWLETVEKQKLDLSPFDVPEKAKEVSAPPAIQAQKDFWGNENNAHLQIGALANRRTSSWYLNSLRDRCVLAIGFLQFAQGHMDEAKKWYAKALLYDQRTADLAKDGEYNDYSRLCAAADQGYFFAHPAELKLYDDHLRFIISVADFYYCSTRFQQAANIAQRLLNGEFGRLTGEQSDYPHYLLGAAYGRLGRQFDSYDEYIHVLDKREGTYTELRAMFAAAMTSSDLPEPMESHGVALLKELGSISGPQRDDYFVPYGQVEYGRALIETGKVDEGIAVLKAIPKKPATWRDIADFYLAHVAALKVQRTGQVLK